MKTPKLKLAPKLDAKGKAIPGRFVGKLVERLYTPRILKGSIELPSERVIRAKAEAKRKRKAQRRLAEQ